MLLAAVVPPAGLIGDRLPLRTGERSEGLVDQVS